MAKNNGTAKEENSPKLMNHLTLKSDNAHEVHGSINYKIYERVQWKLGLKLLWKSNKLEETVVGALKLPKTVNCGTQVVACSTEMHKSWASEFLVHWWGTPNEVVPPNHLTLKSSDPQFFLSCPPAAARLNFFNPC
jgi:hypothetical protein